MNIDREAQKQILEVLKTAYPDRLDTREARLQKVLPDLRELGANVAYLEEHGFVDVRWNGNLQVGAAKITARGLDFLAGDGGLSAILGVVTVRLHEDTLKAILIERVEASSEPEEVKSKIKQQIRSLPAEALRTITTELIKNLLPRVPDAFHWLQAYLNG